MFQPLDQPPPKRQRQRQRIDEAGDNDDTATTKDDAATNITACPNVNASATASAASASAVSTTPPSENNTSNDISSSNGGTNGIPNRDHHQQQQQQQQQQQPSTQCNNEVIDLTNSNISDPATNKMPFEDDSDIEIIVLPSRCTKIDSNDVNNDVYAGNASADDDIETNEIQVTASTMTRANVEYAHVRYQCGIHPFSTTSDADDTAKHKHTQHCAKCYCYVCDILASECAQWNNSHCHAHDKEAKWVTLRKGTLAKKSRGKKDNDDDGEVVPIPSNNLHAGNQSDQQNQSHDVTIFSAQEALMPPYPKIPPLVTTNRKKLRQESGWRWASKHGIAPPKPIYTHADVALWPVEAADLYRATKIHRDAKYASGYMRWWFSEHEGMPGKVPKVPHSAYSMYYKEQKREIYLEKGKFEPKRDGRRIGATWKKLGEDEKKPFYDKFAVLKAQKIVNEEWWSEKIVEWREERLVSLRLRAQGNEELDPVKRQNAGLEPICDCSKCGPTSNILPI